MPFSARFTQGDSTKQANGFYDGDGTYRVRFMPDKQGEWHYVTASSSAELSGKNGAFTVTQPSADNHGPVRVTNTYHFAYADGAPFCQIGTTAYNWAQQGNSTEEQTLATLAAAPFNKIRFVALPSQPYSNLVADIAYPFQGAPPHDWDFTRFNPKYFQHLEQRLGQLRGLGIEADLILFQPYDKGRLGYDRMEPANDDRYLRYLIARLGAYRNIWWSLANEYDLMKEKKRLRLGPPFPNRAGQRSLPASALHPQLNAHLQQQPAVGHPCQHPKRLGGGRRRPRRTLPRRLAQARCLR